VAILLDTNILLRSVQQQHPHAISATRAVDAFRNRNEILCITQQNIVEFWAVATRPLGLNGLGLAAEQASAEIETLKSLFYLLPEFPLQSTWEQLVVRYRISGKNVHDARLVAAMLVHRVDAILTFNVQDFTRYAEISVLDPSLVA
jgi:predicted nucleic acid-binding protein